MAVSFNLKSVWNVCPCTNWRVEVETCFWFKISAAHEESVLGMVWSSKQRWHFRKQTWIIAGRNKYLHCSFTIACIGKIIATTYDYGWKIKTNFRAILKLFVQASKCHRNPWKSHFLPQKVTKSTIWNGSSVKWTLVDLDFAFVNDFQFSVCPSATKMNYFELHYKWLHLVLSWQIQVSLWNSFLETFQKYPMIF